MADCLFCRIVAKEIPAQIVAETEHCLAFRDISPQAPTHVLVIPKIHIPSLSRPNGTIVMALLAKMAQDVAVSLGIDETGWRFVVNTGVDGGQTVHHLHAHVLGGRAMHWPPG